jgi:hypothetical protein
VSARCWAQEEISEEWLREQLTDAPPFFRDTKLDVNLRSYYLNEGTLNGARNEAWAGGGPLAYKSGWLLDRFSVGAVLYTSQPLYAPSHRDGTLLLEEGQNGYTVLGHLYARVRLIDSIFLNLYRYTYDTPYLLARRSVRTRPIRSGPGPSSG